MHMSIIYGTTDKDKAKEMDQELKQGNPLNELIDIDEESLASLIPEADYITDNIPTEDDNLNNTIESLGIHNLLDFLGEYFDKKYFDLKIKDYHIEAVQKPNAAAEYEKEYEAALDLRALIVSLPKYFDNRTKYNPALILFPDNERVSDAAAKVKLNPVTYYIYPQVIGDFHC